MADDIEIGAWSRSGIAVAWAATAAIAAAWYVAIRPVRLDAGALAAVGPVAIGGVIVLTRCRMPALAKAVLLAAGCGSLLTCFATQDPLGLRAVEARTAAALDDSGARAAARVHVRGSTSISVTAANPAARAVADSVADIARARLAGSDVGLTARVAIGRDGAVQLNWSLMRGEIRLWCGVHSQRPRAGKLALAGFGDLLAAAADRSRAGMLVCA